MAAREAKRWRRCLKWRWKNAKERWRGIKRQWWGVKGRLRFVQVWRGVFKGNGVTLEDGEDVLKGNREALKGGGKAFIYNEEESKADTDA